jgi:hypothetical protein
MKYPSGRDIVCFMRSDTKKENQTDSLDRSVSAEQQPSSKSVADSSDDLHLSP